MLKSAILSFNNRNLNFNPLSTKISNKNFHFMGALRKGWVKIFLVVQGIFSSAPIVTLNNNDLSLRDFRYVARIIFKRNSFVLAGSTQSKDLRRKLLYLCKTNRITALKIRKLYLYFVYFKLCVYFERGPPIPLKMMPAQNLECRLLEVGRFIQPTISFLEIFFFRNKNKQTWCTLALPILFSLSYRCPKG